MNDLMRVAASSGSFSGTENFSEKEMNKTIYMLWRDEDPKADLPTKVERASVYYEKKYGQRPNAVYVPLSTVLSGKFPDEMKVETKREMYGNHLLIGVE